MQYLVGKVIATDGIATVEETTASVVALVDVVPVVAGLGCGGTKKEKCSQNRLRTRG